MGKIIYCRYCGPYKKRKSGSHLCNDCHDKSRRLRDMGYTNEQIFKELKWPVEPAVQMELPLKEVN